MALKNLDQVHPRTSRMTGALCMKSSFCYLRPIKSEIALKYSCSFYENQQQE